MAQPPSDSPLTPQRDRSSLAITAITRPSLLARIGFKLVRNVLIWPFFKLLFKGRVVNPERISASKPVLVVANHGSYLDPPLLGACLDWPVSFMAKAELFRLPLLGSIVRSLGAIPVRRGHVDRKTFSACSDQLRRGWLVALFIEGTRSADGRVHRPRNGAALLAARTQLPLLPVAIVGSHRALPRGSRRPRPVPVHIRIGTALPPPVSGSKTDLDATTAACAAAINALLDLG